MLRLLLIIFAVLIVWWFLKDKAAQLRLYLRYELYWWMFPR